MTSVFHYLAYLDSCSPKFQSYIDRNPYIAQRGKWVKMWRVTKCHSMPPNISQCPLPLEHASNKLNTIELIYHFQDLVIKDCWFSYKRLLISLSLSLLNHLLWGKPASWGPAQWRSPCGKEPRPPNPKPLKNTKNLSLPATTWVSLEVDSVANCGPDQLLVCSCIGDLELKSPSYGSQISDPQCICLLF